MNICSEHPGEHIASFKYELRQHLNVRKQKMGIPVRLRILRAIILILGKLAGDEEYAYEAIGEIPP